MVSQDEEQPLVIVTGLSGAGMSSALKDLEDIGYEVFDNFPLVLVEPLLANPGGIRPVAIGIDTRARGFDPDLILEMVDHFHATLLFLHADETVLQKRFTETRRRHPVAGDRPVIAGIRKEQEWLHKLRKEADVVVDTTDLSVHDLRRQLEGYFGIEEAKAMVITLMSFGFKYGLPREADLVMDVRFLKNPHWEPDLKPLTGFDQAVGAYIEKDQNYHPFIKNFQELVAPLLPLYAHEGKSYLTLAVGCTGGRHRSVYTVEKLKPWLEAQGFTVNIMHRDIDRRAG